MTASVISNIIGGCAVALLLGIVRVTWGVRKDFRRFMTEHMWLIATTMWTRDKVWQIMAKLDMPMTEPPPADLPAKKG